MSPQVHNSSKLNNDEADEEPKSNKLSAGWHQNNMNSLSSSSGQKLGVSSYSATASLSNSDVSNDTTDANKANYSAMTKKRKAMHQANSSNRNSADDNVNK